MAAEKTFINLNVKECGDVYPQLIKEAEIHWQSAQKIAEEKNYGLAISTMIISTEELVKATVLFADANGFEFRNVNGMVALFKNHNIRYLILFVMFVVGVFGNELKKFALEIFKHPDQLKPFTCESEE